MRISTGQIFTSANRNMMENQTSLLEIQNKISSGKKFTSLAEDPVGASRVVGLQRELAQLKMFQSNIDASRRRLELEGTTLDDLNTASDRARGLVLQAANGTLGDADRQIISYELEELVGYMAGLMNTRDAKGEYLFSGSQGQVQTYTQQGNRYVFQGDATTRQIQVSSELYVRSSDSGQFLFESVIDEPGLKATGSLQSSFDPENLTVTDPDAFAALMRRTGDISVEVDQYFDGTDTTYSYSLRDSAGNIIEDSQGNPLQTQFYDATAVPLIQLDGASLELDLPIPVTGTPGVRGTDLTSTEETSLNVLDADAYTNLMRQAGGEILIRSEEDLLNPGTYLYKAYAANGIDELTDGAVPTPAPLLTVSPPVAPDVEPTLTFTDATGTPALEFEKDAVADATTAEVSMQFVPPADLKLSFSQPPSNILNTLLDTIELMREPVVGNAQAQTELQERFAKTLDQISLSQERLSEATATLGSRLNTLDDAEMSNTDFKLMTEGTLSSVQDLDYAAAGTELTKRKLALEAAYASFAKIQDLSLFNYIR
jgi:flagellin-like hook-associated protein FlgL